MPFFPLPEPSDPPVTGVIGPVRESRELRDWTLVLSSMGIAHAVRPGSPGWVILVAGEDHPRAVDAIRQYEAENRDWPPPRVKERLPYPQSLAAPLAMLVLVLFYAVSGPVKDSSAWFTHGTASSERILHGEWWRTVTALTLHADTMHLWGNALTGSIFLSAVNRRLGDGRGPLLMLAGGALGNGLNAWWHRATGHLSIGASTAVFAAVGILVATQIADDHQRHRGSRFSIERIGPLVGGLALLGMLGASPHTDLLAHLFGLIGGVAVGLVAALAARRSIAAGAPRAGRSRVQIGQIAAAALAVAVLAASWALAFGRPA